MSKHTPGPWETRKVNFQFNDGWNHGTHKWEIIRRDWDGIDCFAVSVVCEASNDYVSQETIDANARLIAAAPDLLWACKETLKIFADEDPRDLQWLRDAIEKAEGK